MPTQTADRYSTTRPATMKGQCATVTQGFLYAPFGEITTEYAPMWQNSVLPKYSFNAKELDEEPGMYYYEARYYAPPTFTSRDPLFEKYFWMSPYAYCANNPMKYVDPSGCEDEGPDDPPGKKTLKPQIRTVQQDNLKSEPMALRQAGSSHSQHSKKRLIKFKGDGIYGVASNGQGNENKVGNGKARQADLGDFTGDMPEAPEEKYKKQDLNFESPFVLSDGKKNTEPYGTEGYIVVENKNSKNNGWVPCFEHIPYKGSADSMNQCARHSKNPNQVVKRAVVTEKYRIKK